MIKEVDFTSMVAYNIWLELNEPHINVVSVSAPSSDFGYEVSARLPRPQIRVTYFEFSREEL